MSAHVIAHLGLIDEEAIALDLAALELAALDHPGVDLDPYRDYLDRLADQLAALGRSAFGAEAQARALAELIGGAHGFAGDRLAYDHPDNADLIRVIDRRRGLPVTLSILYVAAARRVGWTAHALNTPGHVLIRVGPETAPALADPFNGGAILDPQALAELLEGVLGPQAAPTAEHLEPMGNRAVLTRLIANQAARALQSGNAERALVLHARMTGVAPANPHLWWERARVELHLGDKAAARTSLSAMLELTRDPQLRAHVNAALDALTASGR
jgi:regulator of sirC expression with transglutaminase-like and TPR domain